MEEMKEKDETRYRTLEVPIPEEVLSIFRASAEDGGSLEEEVEKGFEKFFSTCQ